MAPLLPDRLGGRQQRGQRRRHRAAQRQQPAQRRIAGRAVEHVAAVRRCHRRVRPAAERAEPDLPHQRPAPGRHQGLAAQARVLVRRGTGTGLPADPVDDRHHRAAGGVRAAALGTACDRLPDLVAAVHAGLRLPLPLPAGPPRGLAPGLHRRCHHLVPTGRWAHW
ncbi:hypothetical protein G6F64_013999 [Rhizopus arrhizus]|uniref:Uncharacterized protein n=1 Tax=Rhizopus oryzae TaxID=64495 RepID=A0A9P7BJD2_RHIOR|nr:hypothetical protein G6F64_013999 [Rhizopus arrhizus]